MADLGGHVTEWGDVLKYPLPVGVIYLLVIVGVIILSATLCLMCKCVEHWQDTRAPRRTALPSTPPSISESKQHLISIA